MTHNSPTPTLAARLNAQNFFNRPLAISETGLMILMRMAEITTIPASAHDNYEDQVGSGSSYSIRNGIACIKVEGVLFRRNDYLTRYLGLTTYETLRRQIGHAVNNPEVKGILLDIDSPGGQSSGCGELADFIYASRLQKPIFAVANDSAFSAAYWIASAATKIYVDRDGGCGSIGCYMLHCDQSGMDEQRGLSYTYIQAGERKTDGNPHEPLADTAAYALQREVDRVRDSFAFAVARNRNVDAKDIFDTEGGVCFAHACVPLLADTIGSKDDAVQDLISATGGDPFGIDADSIDDYDDSSTTTASPATYRPTGQIRDQVEISVISRMFRTIPEGYSLGDSGVSYAPDANVAIPVVRRSSIDTIITNSRQISMLVVPYNSPSVDLGGFKEIYSPGCFSGGLDNDPCVFWNHDELLILGRQSTNARFVETSVGVRCDCDLPDDVSYADDLLVLIRNKIITQSSAGFYILKAHWEDRRGQRFRVIDKALMREAAPVSIPAYKAATATVQ
jgi:HK97 family phage prohead protease